MRWAGQQAGSVPFEQVNQRFDRQLMSVISPSGHERQAAKYRPGHEVARLREYEEKGKRLDRKFTGP